MNDTKTILVIFGITGDLAKRKLLPALRNIIREDALPHTKIVGISRRSLSVEELLDTTIGSAPSEARAELARALSIFTMDLANSRDYSRLKKQISLLAEKMGGDTQVIFYLSVPPQATLPIVENLGQAGLNSSSTKLLLEKPFGVDLVSAQEFIAGIAQYYEENQIYRIDHYLAKEMAQNIIVFRSQNAIFRNLWHKEFIEKIDIISSEDIGIEGRSIFYEQTGALRDVLQNHLMQLMALVLMDLQPTGSHDDIPQRRHRALAAIAPINPDTFPANVRRGQYIGYSEEVENPGSQTETFVALTVYSDQERWKGVPIRLITGKRLASRTTEIRVHFKQSRATESNLLVLHIQPKEGVEIDLFAKKPGFEKRLERVSLAFQYDHSVQSPMEAYERVLVDAIYSDKSLFTSADEVLAAWKILQPVQNHWAFHTDDMKLYPNGSDIEDILDNL